MSTSPIPRIGEVSIEHLRFPFEISLKRLAIAKYLLRSCQDLFEPGMAYKQEGKMNWNHIDVGLEIRTELEFILQCHGRKLNMNLNYEEMIFSFVDIVVEWMNHIHRYVFRPIRQHPLKAVSYLHCIVLNERGLINYAATARNLLREQTLSNNDKLRIACVYCLEEEMRGMNFPKNLRTFNAYPKKLSTFWKVYLLDGRMEDVESLVRVVCRNNEPALNFFWNKLTDEQKRKNVPKLFRYCNANLQCHLMNMLNADEQRAVLTDYAKDFLINLRSDFLWSQYFYQVVFFSLRFIREKQYMEVLENIAYQIDKYAFRTNQKHVRMIRDLWNYAPQRFKDFFFRRKAENIASFFFYLFDGWDFDFLKQVLSEAPDAMRRQFFECQNGMRIWCNMLEDLHQDFKTFHELVAIAYPLAENALQFKIKLVNTTVGRNILNNYVSGSRGNNRERFEEFLREMFITEENVNVFKKQYLLQPGCCIEDHIRKVFFTTSCCNEIRNVLECDRVIEYVRLFLSTEEEVESFKKKDLCKIAAVKITILRVIEHQRYDLVETFLHWCFNDERLIADYKSDFYVSEVKSTCISIASKFVQLDDNFRSFIRFVSWFCDNDEKIRGFGTVMITDVDQCLEMWRVILYNKRFEFADCLLQLCGINTPEEIAAYKSNLLLKLNWGYVMFERHYLYHIHGLSEAERANEEVMELKKRIGMDIYNWLNPTEEIIRRFIWQNRTSSIGATFFANHTVDAVVRRLFTSEINA